MFSNNNNVYGVCKGEECNHNYGNIFKVSGHVYGAVKDS